METVEVTTLEQIIKFNNGLNAMSNIGINLNMDLSYELSLFKQKILPYVTAYTDTIKEIKGTEEEMHAEITELLNKEYEVIMPKIPLSALKESKVEVPLGIFDFIGNQITR